MSPDIISCAFGFRIPPTEGASSDHNGIDIKIPIGTEIKSVLAGTVESIDTIGNTNSGKYVRIKHNDGSITAYAHLSQVSVQKSQSVSKGQQIGLSGNTGIGTGAHLHFRYINPQGQNEDPCKNLFSCTESDRCMI